MAIFLTETDVQELLPMERALECVEASFLALAAGRATNCPRKRLFVPRASLHYMAASLPEDHVMGMKVYTITPADWRFVVLLFSTETGDLLSLMEADHLGRIRTGAASGVATKILARREASRVGLIGTGRQARTQLEAVSRVRPIKTARVYSRNENRRRDFCHEMSERLQIEVQPAENAETCVRFGEVVIAATTSREPVVRGEWLQPGSHVNAIGANMADRREVDDTVLARASVIAVDSLEQAREESGDLVQGLAGLRRDWEEVVELHEIVAGRRPGRRSESDLTLFKSNGIALWDVAVAAYIYQQALEKGRGRKLEFPCP